MGMRGKGDGKPGAAMSGTPGLGGRVQATCLPQGRITRCALTSPVLSSAISQTQTQWDFLAVLTDAIRRYGAPEALVTDGGGQFYSSVALQLYDMLGIRKERIDPGEPWMNYAETLLYVTWNYLSC